MAVSVTETSNSLAIVNISLKCISRFGNFSCRRDVGKTYSDANVFASYSWDELLTFMLDDKFISEMLLQQYNLS